MKGTVLKEYGELRFCGIINFLDLWKEDAAKALNEKTMGDRDSYPGEYIARLVDEGYILKDEAEEACLEWFDRRLYLDLANGRRGLCEVIWFISVMPFKRVWAKTAENLEELLAVNSREDRTILQVAAMAHPKGRGRDLLVKLFFDSYWRDASLFRLLFVESGSLSEQEREKIISRLCRMARRIKRVTGENTEEVRSLRYMLLDHFDPQGFSRWGNPTHFAEVEAKALKWLAYNAAECPFPARMSKPL